MKWLILMLAASGLHAGQTWTVRLEEPTGLFRRDNEAVRIPLAKVGGARAGYTVVDARGRESVWQVAGDELLFAASVIPGETPEYKVSCCSAGAAPAFASGVYARQLGMRRVEFGNRYFRAVYDTGVPAITEVYPLSAAPHRSLNLVETTPEVADPADLHKASYTPMPPVPGVEGPNNGWSTLGGTGPLTATIVSAGPIEGKILLKREGETQEIRWTALGRWFRWSGSRGFRFAAVSASPFLPFDRFVDLPESELWPDVSSSEEPEEHRVEPRAYRRLRGGHGVYYALAENYGALGIVALDAELGWTGIGSRRFVGDKPTGPAEIAVTFPEWDGFRTLLNARRENRIVREPVLARVSGPAQVPMPAVVRRAEVVPRVRLDGRSASPFTEDALDLSGTWELAWCEKGCERPEGEWRTVAVPGTPHIQWLGRERAMTREAEWVSRMEWWYRKRVRVPLRWASKRLRLHFEATDYYADTWVNGRFAGRHEGYIDPYEHDITALVKAGAEAEILVRTWTPVTYYWRSRPYTVKGAYGAVDQKPDEITALGITRPVRIIADEGASVGEVAVATRLTAEGAEVEVEFEEDGRWELTLSPRNFQSPERHRLSGRGRRFVIPVKDPRLWWTWDHGRPNLYTLHVRRLSGDGSVLDGRSLAVGIREIEKIGWNFYLNRRRMFIRGTNYYYNLFLSEMDRAKYGRDMDLMIGMNVNTIRLHCHFSNPEFYDLADERGVLLWQDYLEAWYPEDTAFSMRAAQLYDNHIRYVRNHPSIALWAASDEESLENYRDLTKHLAPRAFLLDPQRRPVVRSTGRYGDSHVYNGWYGGSIWEYGTMEDVFVSELGATSLPNYETLIRFLPHNWPIQEHADEWKWRKLQIPEAMRAWGDPGGMSLQEYIPRTQAYTARLFQIALERARRRKADGAGGILHFHAIDIWPSITMAAIDVDRIPTKTYYTVQRSFQPVLASIEYDRDSWKTGELLHCSIWAINDRWDAVPNARIDWQIEDASGQAVAAGDFAVSMPADSAQKTGSVEWTAGHAGAWKLRAAVRDAAGATISENVYEFEVVR